MTNNYARSISADAHGIFGTHAGSYIDAGLAPFPVRTREKKPAIKGWQRATRAKSRAWAARLGGADGLGFEVGKQSGIVEVDVDAVGNAYLQQALDRFGVTPIVIATASGKHKLWYRWDGEGRLIRPFGDADPIDILGDGYTIAPPSERPDLGSSYRFLNGGLGDLSGLPVINAGAIPDKSGGDAQTIREGGRNNATFHFAMMQARHCDDEAALIDAVLTWAARMPEPLPESEVERAAVSAWGYESRGLNFVGLKRPQVSELDVIQDRLAHSPEALALFLMFQRYHIGKPHFVIAPRAMAQAKNPPWDFRRIERAREVLLNEGLLVEVRAPRPGHRSPGLYKLGEISGGKGVK